MKVLILGGSGMLGHKLWQVLSSRFDTYVTMRGSADRYRRYGIFDPGRVIDGVQGQDIDSVTRAMAVATPDVVVNAIGIVKQLKEAKDTITSLTINSLFPHRVAALCAASSGRFIHISTDCVFSGEAGPYRETDAQDASDLYGRSKLLGEVSEGRALTLRTSIIGRELGSAHGLVEWFLQSKEPKVRGFTQARFSGFPTVVLAELIADLIEKHPHLAGLYQVSTDPINKYDLLSLIGKAYGKKVEIEPDASVKIDRSLNSDRFREATGYQPSSWPGLVERMAGDKTPYDNWS